MGLRVDRDLSLLHALEQRRLRLGEARLISSPSTMLAKIAPGLNSKSPVS